VLPTDTVYGLAASAHDEQAVTRLYELKHRERKPGTIIAASVSQLIELGFDKTMLTKAAKFWPDSLSVVVPVSREIPYLDQGVGDQPLRIPKDEKLRALLEQTGPLVTSSANDPGEPTAETIEEAYAYFHDTVDFYVDGGTMAGRAPSTIIRIAANGAIEVLRDGAVKITSSRLA
jgi:tRNA threonylcarbamoyl adenosine modification protein (Sua5/YciO/YrdC/YwlC family)